MFFISPGTLLYQQTDHVFNTVSDPWFVLGWLLMQPFAMPECAKSVLLAETAGFRVLLA